MAAGGDPMTALTERFMRAVDYAHTAHAGQARSGSVIPYATACRA